MKKRAKNDSSRKNRRGNQADNPAKTREDWELQKFR